MKDLAKLLANFNVKLKVSEETKPGEVQKALAEMAGKPEERLVSTVALRSLKQAVYQTENIGHFGLAAEYYTHFTSPIRRYPDLIVHRLLHEWVSDPAMNDQKSEKLELNLDAIAEHSSIRERAAAEAERATVDLKKQNIWPAISAKNSTELFPASLPSECLSNWRTVLKGWYIFPA